MSGARRTRLPFFALLVALSVGVGAASRAVHAGPTAKVPPQPWELEVERETTIQDASIKQAKLTKTMASVVSRYENRVFRDPSALNEYLLGRALYHADSPAAAKAAMERCLVANPGFHYAHLRLAKLLIDLKNLPDAETHLRAVLAAKPGDAEALNVLAQIAIAKKDWNAARSYINQRLADDPSDLAARQSLAMVYYQSKDWPSAKRELEGLVRADSANLGYRFLLGKVLLELGEVDASIGWLESILREQPASLEALQALSGAYLRKEDWSRLRVTLERSLPYLDPEMRTKVLADIQRLRDANGGPPRMARDDQPKESALESLLRAVEDPEPKRREDALLLIYDVCVSGELKQVPAKVLRRITSDVEPSEIARATVIQILGLLRPEHVLTLLGVALYDESERVRMLAAEAIGKAEQPVGIAYLLPFLASEGISIREYQSVRGALSRITGFRDLPPESKTVSTEADVAASREAWRRWGLTDASIPVKRAAVTQLIEFREQSAERFLYNFVLDPSFDVMHDAYVAMRAAIARPPRDPVETKAFALFPSVPDAEVTRASMRSIQDRVVAWWKNFVAERSAYIRAGRPSSPPPSDGTPPK